MFIEHKLHKANEIVKDAIKKRYNRNTWQYTDYVLEDRFLHEIKDDGFDVVANTDEQIAEYAIEQIIDKNGISYVID